MHKKSWHERLLKTEAIFHTLAVACVLRGLLSSGESATAWFAAAPSIMTLGRVLPTEEVDDALDIPLTGDRPKRSKNGELAEATDQEQSPNAGDDQP
jgi:hypothetical protein